MDMTEEEHMIISTSSVEKFVLLIGTKSRLLLPICTISIQTASSPNSGNYRFA